MGYVATLVKSIQITFISLALNHKQPASHAHSWKVFTTSPVSFISFATIDHKRLTCPHDLSADLGVGRPLGGVCSLGVSLAVKCHVEAGVVNLVSESSA